MKVLAFGGFLGSGKTTVIKNMLSAMVAEGDKVAIIENEIGAVGIDDKVLSDSQVDMTVLAGGCVCCSISGSLISAVSKIREQLAPDWLVIELTGMAFVSGVRELFEKFEKFGGERIEMKAVTIIDIARWKALITVVRPLLSDQVEGADVVVINKIDLCAPQQEELDGIREMSGGVPMLLTSAATCPTGQLWQEIKPLLG